MLMFEDTVTIFNLYNEIWYPTILQGVEVQEVTGQTESKDGSKPANTCSLHIPENLMVNYKKPKEYQGEGFTIKEGDFFVVGDFSSGPIDENDYESGYLTYMRNTYDSVYHINSVGFYKTIRHIEVAAS